MTNLRIEQEALDGGRTVIYARGALDVHSSPRLRSALFDAVDAGADAIVVDLGEIDFVDSAGFSALLAAAKRLAHRDGHLVLVSNDESVTRMLRIMGLTGVIPVAATRDEAWASLDAAS